MLYIHYTVLYVQENTDNSFSYIQVVLLLKKNKKHHISLDDADIFGIVLHSQTLTCQKDFGLAADQQAIAVLGSTVVLANIAVASLFAFLKALD